MTILLLAGLALSFSACGSQQIAPTSEDILTQTVISPDKTPVTILVKYAFGINAFEREAEKVFPNIDIIQVGNYTRDMGIEEYKARIKNDDLTDIVMTWPLEPGEEYWEERLLDLSSLPMTGKYATSMLNGISQDGALYYLPGPLQVRGIVYNKTLFEERGWSVPKDFEGFIALCHEIEESGMRSLQLGLGNLEVLDTAFVGYSYGSCFGKPENAKWISDYNRGIGSFGENFAPALETFQRLVDEGVLKKEDLDITYAERELMLFWRECAMIEDSVLLARMGGNLTGSTDEFALMPFFDPGENNDWARLYPVCYIGVNKHLGEPENSKKYDLVMQLLEYISTPEGQKALAGDTGAMFSVLNGTEPPDTPEIEDLLPALIHGRYAVFPTLKNAQSALRRGLKGMVSGEYSAEDVIKMVDSENRNPPIKMVALPLGVAEEDFTFVEMGSFLADAMREQSGCEIALFMDNGKDGKYNGKGISGRFYAGEITITDIKRVLPDLKHGEKGELLEITMTGEDLIKTLEYAIPVDNNVTGWFYYFSGLRMEFNPSAEPGERISKITDENGAEIDSKRLYSVAVMDGTVPEKFVQSCKSSGMLISDALLSAVQATETISPGKDGRFVICQP